jgi:small GTP-binding protein|tara:strand:- start:486 stop:1043 length:558 start_codon:yes stop_codon:yes gene_type:complete
MGACSSQPKQRHKVLMLGLANAGKTSTIAALSTSTGSTSTIPTVGSSVTELTYKGRCFDLHDVGGQDHLRELWRYHYVGAVGVIFIVDSCDTDSFAAARDALFGALRDPALRVNFVAVLANKRDGDGAATQADIAAALHFDEINDLRGGSVRARIFLTIATQNEGLSDAMFWAADQLKNTAGTAA